MTLTRLGLHFSSLSYKGSESADLFRRVLEVVEIAEATGFDSIWVPDHVHQQGRVGEQEGADKPMLESYTFLGALAARTQRARLGTLVTPITLRSPAMLAKVVTTLDVVSEGRAVLALGTGWDAEEHVAYGLPFPSLTERYQLLEETIEICKLMFAGPGPVDYSGANFTVSQAWNSPPPVQSKLPILIGGSGEKRTLPLVAKYADACNISGTPAEVTHKLEVLRRLCDEVGRDFDEISKTATIFDPPDLDDFRRLFSEYLAVGMDGVVLFGTNCPDPATVEHWGIALSRDLGDATDSGDR